MRSTESKIFIATRILYLVFILFGLIALERRSYKELMSEYIFAGVVGVIIAFFLTKNYDEEKIWARNLLVIANVIGIFVFINNIPEVARMARRSRYEVVGNIGVLVYILCLMASFLILIKMYKKSKLILSPVFETNTPLTESPESRLENLKSLLDKELITKEEFDQKKQQILNQM